MKIKSLFLLLFALSTSASAQLIEGYTGFGSGTDFYHRNSISTYQDNYSANHTSTLQSTDLSFKQGIASYQVNSAPFAYASSNVVGQHADEFGVNSLNAEAGLRYQFLVNGTPGYTVPISFNAQLASDLSFDQTPNSAGGASDGLSIAGLIINRTSYAQVGCNNTTPCDAYSSNAQLSDCAGSSPYSTWNICAGVSGTNEVQLDLSGQAMVTVELFTQAFAYTTVAQPWLSDQYHGFAHAAAFADPYFYIDPVWTSANPLASARLVFLDGVGNALMMAPVPEPETNGMMLAGLGLMIFAKYRRRRVSATR
jgi:hypothetical protein